MGGPTPALAPSSALHFFCQPWRWCAAAKGSRHLGLLMHSQGEKTPGEMRSRGVGGMVGIRAATVWRTVGRRLQRATVSHKGLRQGWGPEWRGGLQTLPLRCMFGGWGHRRMGAKTHPPSTLCPWRRCAPPKGRRHLKPLGHSQGEKAVGEVGTKGVGGMVGFRGMDGHSSGVWVVIGGNDHRGWWGTYFGGGKLTLIL